MKRILVAGALLLSSVLNASADTVLWANIAKHARGRSQMHADYNACSWGFGTPMDGTPVSSSFKQCMLQKGWRFVSEDRNWDEINGSEICHHGMFWGTPSVDCKDM